MRWGVYAIGLTGLALMILSGCQQPQPSSSESSPDQEASPDKATKADKEAKDEKDEKTEDDHEKSTPEEKKFLAVAQPFIEALAARNYAKAYGLLSVQAKAQMMEIQFKLPGHEADGEVKALAPLMNPSLEDFQKLMQMMEQEYGRPVTIRRSYVMSLDPKVLKGEAEGVDRLEVAFSIGEMPNSIPKDIRRASIRSQIGTKLTEEQLQAEAKRRETTVEDLQEEALKDGVSKAEIEKGGPLQTYCNLKVVLIEENGELKVGYFEFTPPSMMD